MNDQKKILPSIGRLRQTDYILWQVLLALICLVLLGLELFAWPLESLIWSSEHPIPLREWIRLGFIIFEIYLTARRLQDCNFSGWFSLLLLVDRINFFGILFMCIYPGTKGTNRFGRDPRRRNSATMQSENDFPGGIH